jgi:hypothetical protein
MCAFRKELDTCRFKVHLNNIMTRRTAECTPSIHSIIHLIHSI